MFPAWVHTKKENLEGDQDIRRTRRAPAARPSTAALPAMVASIRAATTLYLMVVPALAFHMSPARVPHLDPLLPPKILLAKAEASLDSGRR